MWKSEGRAPSLRVLPWHLPYNRRKSMKTEENARLKKKFNMYINECYKSLQLSLYFQHINRHWNQKFKKH